MTNAANGTDFVQPPATVYSGDWPQAGIFYTWSHDGVVCHYFLATGERMKNGKFVVYQHDVHHGRNKRVTRTGMDLDWFRSLKRADIVPARVHALLTAALPK